jgi:hypothetical protein
MKEKKGGEKWFFGAHFAITEFSNLKFNRWCSPIDGA